MRVVCTRLVLPSRDGRSGSIDTRCLSFFASVPRQLAPAFLRCARIRGVRRHPMGQQAARKPNTIHSASAAEVPNDLPDGDSAQGRCAGPGSLLIPGVAAPSCGLSVDIHARRHTLGCVPTPDQFRSAHQRAGRSTPAIRHERDIVHACELLSTTPDDDGATAAVTTDCGNVPTPDSLIGAATVTTAGAACRTGSQQRSVASRPAPEARSAEERKRRGSTAWTGHRQTAAYSEGSGGLTSEPPP
jgi:hypothetical protein